MARDISCSENWEQESRYNFCGRNNFDNHLPLRKFARRSRNSMMQLSTPSWNNVNESAERDHLNILIRSKSDHFPPCLFRPCITPHFEFSTKCWISLSCFIIKVVTWIFVKVALYLFIALWQSKPSWSLTKISRLVEASAFELKVLNESKSSMSWVRCAFGNV